MTVSATANRVTSVHPDDILFFQEVSAAMFRVAKNYGLPLRSVTHDSNPENGKAAFGRCSSSGDIIIVLRPTFGGEWASEPLSPERVWETAAHELAHLRHLNHGLAFSEFHMELRTAMKNQQEDHKEKVLRKLVKMQAQRDDAAKRAKEGEGRAQEEAEAFAAAINRMLLEYELNPSEIDYARASSEDPVIELKADLDKYQIKRVKNRVAWQEELARVVARAHLCTFALSPGRNQIWFVGTRSHATVAEYVYGLLASTADKMSHREGARYRAGLREKYGIKPSHSLRGVKEAFGFRESWLGAFTTRIMERLEEEKRKIVAETAALSPDVPGAESLALVRLNGALVKVQSYIDGKFKARRGAQPLSNSMGTNAAGHALGKAAADKMPIGRKVMSGGVGVRGLLK